jgi:hypothetical protein
MLLSRGHSPSCAVDLDEQPSANNFAREDLEFSPKMLEEVRGGRMGRLSKRGTKTLWADRRRHSPSTSGTERFGRTAMLHWSRTTSPPT